MHFYFDCIEGGLFDFIVSTKKSMLLEVFLLIFGLIVNVYKLAEFLNVMVVNFLDGRLVFPLQELDNRAFKKTSRRTLILSNLLI